MSFSVKHTGFLSYRCEFNVNNADVSKWLSTNGETLRGVAFKHIDDEVVFRDIPKDQLTNAVRLGNGVTCALAGFGLLGVSLLTLGVTALSFTGVRVALHHSKVVTTWINGFQQTYRQFSGSWGSVAALSFIGVFIGVPVTLTVGVGCALFGLPLAVYGSAYLAKSATCYGTGSLMKSSAKLFQQEVTAE